MRLKPYGPRGVAMLFLAALALTRAFAYLQPSSPAFTPSILTEWIVPIWVWGILWLGTAIHLSVTACRMNHALALAAIQSMSLLWAIVYIIAAWNRATVDGLFMASGTIITAVVYICFAGLIYYLSKMVNLSRKDFEVRAHG
ncbi:MULTISPECIES: hypothetical protein [unclassified Arthrobacter]|uniref:hypothetical protein n=1 Tax=unclassified Arthrobacter TaxID=235627 RepID=UPI0014915FDF|nr:MULTISPECIES: hypothetical protein [unclassified Arthrobacter]MBE0009609.1 hypothetical protein [Arthrobacter sp. AET 35A]NOJ63360.1 hypothetical protein [Arthrobacter sp. 147(2020)]